MPPKKSKPVAATRDPTATTSTSRVAAPEAGPQAPEGGGLTDELGCGICFESSYEFRGKLDSCEHVFCLSCIKKWSDSSNTCPSCKRRFVSIVKIEVTSGKKKGAKIAIKYKDLKDETPSFPLFVSSIRHQDMILQALQHFTSRMAMNSRSRHTFMNMPFLFPLTHSYDEDEDDDEDYDPEYFSEHWPESDESGEGDEFGDDDVELDASVASDDELYDFCPECNGFHASRRRTVRGPGSSSANPVILDDDDDDEVEILATEERAASTSAAAGSEHRPAARTASGSSSSSSSSSSQKRKASEDGETSNKRRRI